MRIRIRQSPLHDDIAQSVLVFQTHLTTLSGSLNLKLGKENFLIKDIHLAVNLRQHLVVGIGLCGVRELERLMVSVKSVGHIATVTIDRAKQIDSHDFLLAVAMMSVVIGHFLHYGL